MITTMPQSQMSSSDPNSHKSGRHPVVSQLGTSAHSQTFICTQNTWYTYIHVMHNSYVYTQCVARTKPEFMRPKLLYLFLYHKLHCKIAILISVKILYLFMTKSSHFENIYTNTRVRSTHLLQFLWKCCLLCPSNDSKLRWQIFATETWFPNLPHLADNSLFSMRGTLLDAIFRCSLDVEIWSSWATNFFSIWPHDTFVQAGRV